MEKVDLYETYKLPRQGAAGGWLHGWIPHIPGNISPRRTRPTVLIFPGGGYNHLSDREAEPVALRFLARGYAAFVLEYSLAPTRYPAPVREAALAMRYLRENAARMGLGKIAVVGFSAGGHLAGLLGTRYGTLADIGAEELLRPDALGLCYPVTISWGKCHAGSFACLTGQDETLTEQLSLERLVQPEMPPVFLWHTRDDGTVPVFGTLAFAQALEAAGVDFAMHIFRRGVHGLSTADARVYPVRGVPEHSRDAADWPEKMMEFFEDVGFSTEDWEG